MGNFTKRQPLLNQVIESNEELLRKWRRTTTVADKWAKTNPHFPPFAKEVSSLQVWWASVISTCVLVRSPTHLLLEVTSRYMSVGEPDYCIPASSTRSHLSSSRLSELLSNRSRNNWSQLQLHMIQWYMAGGVKTARLRLKALQNCK